MAMFETLNRRVQDGRELINTMREHAWIAQQETGKRVWSQALEIVRLRKGVGKLDPDEYYQYGLYDDRRFTWEQKQQFFGRRMENGLIPILGESWWVGLANDKMIAYAFLKGLGFPIPEPFAVYHPWRSVGEVPVLRTPAAVAEFVRQQRVPFVVKPVFGMSGRDVCSVRAYDATRDAVTLTDGTIASVDDFATRIVSTRDQGGMLFQELLTPHPEIHERCGDRLCTVRMVTIVNREGPRLITSLWKVATGGSMTDNYCRGSNNNLVAPIDAETGVIGRTCTGVGREFRYVDQHPDTGRVLPGFQLPDWRAAVDICLAATASIPQLAMQAWDVALTSRGPVLLEVNVNGGMTLPQLCVGAGIFRGQFAEFLAKNGYPASVKKQPRLASLSLAKLWSR
jgi:hypothetical protein